MPDTVSYAREIAIGALFLALALVLPIIFHAVGLGKVFLPMLLPVLIVGFLVPWRTAASCGLLAPLLSALLTGMPPFMPPIALIMMFELAILGGLAALLYRTWRQPLWGALAAAIIGSRLVNFGLHYLLAEFFAIPGLVWGTVTLISGLPGVLLQILMVPLAVSQIEKRHPEFKPRTLNQKKSEPLPSGG